MQRMSSYKLVLICLLFLAGLALAQTSSYGQDSAGTGAAGVIYVAPNGDDSRTGKSPDQALRTLQRVQTKLKNGEIKIEGKELHVKFLPGTYSRMGVAWDYVAPDHTIVFEPSTSSPGTFPVVVDGTGDGLGQFFQLSIASPSPAPVNTGIVIRDLHITNYCEGVSIGDWESKALISGNLLEGNKFSRIGSKYEQPTLQKDGRKLPKGDCVAAVRLNNASNNIIRKNTFANIENVPSNQTASQKYGPTLLHAIYINRKSSNNIIEANTFTNFTGSPVRIRNQSDNNKIIGNTFDAPIYVNKKKPKRMKAVSQWYCNTATEACREKAKRLGGECPSSGIEITKNTVRGDLDLYGDDSQSQSPTGAAACGGSSKSFQPRISN